jgi:hypothetical protein
VTVKLFLCALLVLFRTQTFVGNMVDTQTLSRSEVIGLIIRLAVLTGVTFFSVRWMISQLDPTNKQKKSAKKKVRYNI